MESPQGLFGHIWWTTIVLTMFQVPLTGGQSQLKIKTNPPPPQEGLFNGWAYMGNWAENKFGQNIIEKSVKELAPDSKVWLQHKPKWETHICTSEHKKYCCATYLLAIRYRHLHSNRTSPRVKQLYQWVLLLFVFRPILQPSIENFQEKHLCSADIIL